jgi:hypothetical protein
MKRLNALALFLALVATTAQGATRYVDRPYPVGSAPCFLKFQNLNLNTYAIREFGVIIDDRPFKPVPALRLTMVDGTFRQTTEGDLRKQEADLLRQIAACTAPVQSTGVSRPLL